MQNEIEIKINDIILRGIIGIPPNAKGVIIFAHGSGSSRHSPRNKYVAEKLQENGFVTLLFDLLTPYEDLEYMNRFNTDLLSKRLQFVTKWVENNEYTKNLPIGYFGASTGAAAAMNAAAEMNHDVRAIVSRGGRPDLAEESLLHKLHSPILLIVGGDDHLVIDLNKNTYEKINGEKEFNIIKGASHLFEEEGTLEKVADLAVGWFKKYLL